MRRTRKAIIIAVVGSLAAHSAFVAYSHFCYMRGIGNVMDETRNIFHLGKVEKTPAVVQLKGDTSKPSIPTIKMTHQAVEEGAAAAQKMAVSEPDKNAALDKKTRIMEKESSPEDLLPLKENFDAKDMLKTEAEEAKRKAAPAVRSLAEQLIDERGLDSDTARDAQKKLSGEADKEDRSLQYAYKDIAQPSQTGVFQPGDKEMLSSMGALQVGKYDEIDRHLEITLRTYEDPATGEKYFELGIGAREGSPLKVMPKEIIFLVDSSKSMTEQKLAYIRETIVNALNEFNPGDKFNVIAFRGDVLMFRERSVEANPENVRQAQAFVRGLEAVGQTDVANALMDITRRIVTSYPSYILLVSDGRPTTGIVDSRLIIQEITRQNNQERPIFCFGGGRRVNRYLLEFISYQNRAWSRFASDSSEIAREFPMLYRQIKDPVLLNVRYRLNNLNFADTYPKFLPDFYKGSRFTVYGRYNKEDVFSMQLLGEIDGSTKELIFKASLKEAEKGGEEIAKGWAFRKIYYLISRETMGIGDQAELRAEVEETSRRYGIITPYDLEDRSED